MHLNRRFYYIYSLLIFFIANSLFASVKYYGKYNDPDFKGILCKDLVLVSGPDNSKDLELKRNSYAQGNRFKSCSNYKDNANSYYSDNSSVDPSVKLLFHFDQQESGFLKDSSGNYKSLSARYRTSKNSISGFSANFVRPEHKIIIQSASFLKGFNQKISQSSPLLTQSFSIDFWIYLTSPNNHSEVFSKISRSGGKLSGIRILIKSGRLVLHAINFFQKILKEGDSLWNVKSNPLFKSKEIILTGRKPLKEKEWYHITLAYNYLTGRLVFIQNGLENASIYTTDTGKRTGVIYHPLRKKFDASPMVIGESFFGFIDEFRITNKYVVNDEGINHDIISSYYPDVKIKYNLLKRKHVSGVALSPVFSTKYSRASFNSVDWTVDVPSGSHGYMEVRFSSKPFDVFDKKIRWVRIGKGEKNIPRIQFFQWRFFLTATPDGQKTPALRDVKINFSEDFPPLPPQKVKVIPELSSSNKICLEWNRNAEVDVVTGGGYNIYYGFKSGEYLGKINWIKGYSGYFTKIDGLTSSPIRKNAQGKWIAQGKLLTKGEKSEIKKNPYLREKLKNKIRVIIDNSVIMNQMRYEKSTDNRIPLLENDRPFYFAVSAYDNQWSAGYKDHESSMSSEVIFIINKPSELNY
jgi:hypothetical protein